MNLAKQKTLAASAMKVGKGRVAFRITRLAEIKEALSKQDIRDLVSDGAIAIKDVSGRRKNTKRKTKRSVGNIRKKVKTRKQDYVIMTRKLRAYTAEMKKQGQVTPEEVIEIRKKIRNRIYKSKAHLKNYIKEIQEIRQ